MPYPFFCRHVRLLLVCGSMFKGLRPVMQGFVVTKPTKGACDQEVQSRGRWLLDVLFIEGPEPSLSSIDSIYITSMYMNWLFHNMAYNMQCVHGVVPRFIPTNFRHCPRALVLVILLVPPLGYTIGNRNLEADILDSSFGKSIEEYRYPVPPTMLPVSFGEPPTIRFSW